MIGSQGLLLDSLVHIYIYIYPLGILEQIIDLTSYYTLCFVPSTPGVLPEGEYLFLLATDSPHFFSETCMILVSFFSSVGFV